VTENVTKKETNSKLEKKGKKEKTWRKKEEGKRNEGEHADTARADLAVCVCISVT